MQRPPPACIDSTLPPKQREEKLRERYDGGHTGCVCMRKEGGGRLELNKTNDSKRGPLLIYFLYSLPPSNSLIQHTLQGSAILFPPPNERQPHEIRKSLFLQSLSSFSFFLLFSFQICSSQLPPSLKIYFPFLSCFLSSFLFLLSLSFPLLLV